jgi:hypothetical protein
LGEATLRVKEAFVRSGEARTGTLERKGYCFLVCVAGSDILDELGSLFWDQGVQQLELEWNKHQQAGRRLYIEIRHMLTPGYQGGGRRPIAFGDFPPGFESDLRIIDWLSIVQVENVWEGFLNNATDFLRDNDRIAPRTAYGVFAINCAPPTPGNDGDCDDDFQYRSIHTEGSPRQPGDPHDFLYRPLFHGTQFFYAQHPEIATTGQGFLSIIHENTAFGPWWSHLANRMADMAPPWEPPD